MENQLIRVGTTYIPVSDPGVSAAWYNEKLGAEVNYEDQDKAIIDLAGQSFFLVKASGNEKANFFDHKGIEHFSLTFEVDGVESLKDLYIKLNSSGVQTWGIEDRGHAGRNFVFSDPDGNRFDVWSELSSVYKKLGD